MSKGIIRGKRLVHLYSLDNQRPKQQQQQTARDPLVLDRLPLPRPAPPVPTAPRWLLSDLSQRLGQAREAAPDDSRQSPKGNGTWNIFLPRSLTENETRVQVVRTGQTRERLFQAPGSVPRGESGFDASCIAAGCAAATRKLSVGVAACNSVVSPAWALASQNPPTPELEGALGIK